MLALPRRWLRQLSYALFFLVVATFLLLIANKHNVIDLLQYIPYDITPSFFQPPSDLYIIDIAIGNCYKFNSGSSSCGIPLNASGRLGNLYQSGGWHRIDKDLTLGSSWTKKQYFSYKEVKTEALNGRIVGKPAESDEKKGKRADIPDNDVIVDIAIANPKQDNKIDGNQKLKLPIYILEEFHASKEFGNEDYAKLVAASKAKQGGKKVQAAPENAGADAKEVNAKLAEIAMEEQEKENQRLAQEAAKTSSSDDKEMDFEEDVKPGSPEESTEGTSREKRKVETSRHELKRLIYIPTEEELKKSGWKYKSNGIWFKYGTPSRKAITGIDILFGEDAVDPRPNWELIKHGPLKGVSAPYDKPAFITIRRGPKVDYKSREFQPTLQLNKDGKFKILQVADLHFSTGFGKCRDPVPADSKKECQADPRTLRFLERVLDLEKPDFVVLTGDQIFGDEAPDAETAVFKALNPFIKRKIPFAATVGNHDDEGSLSRKDVMSLMASLPYSFAGLGPESVDGVGNYAVLVEGSNTKLPAISLYFLDTHKYSVNPKVNPGYDWLKDTQLNWLGQEAASIKKDVELFKGKHLSMAFFHIPLPEYRHLDQHVVGTQKEAVTAPRYNSGARKVLGEIGVQAVSVGHDHANDYCVNDAIDVDTSGENRMWLCYGGGSGEGGYGGYGGYIRRMRVYDFDPKEGVIKTWKRAEINPDEVFDDQPLVAGGNIVA